MIMVAAIFYTTTSPPFPGIAALLPVAGGLAVIWAGGPRLPWAPARVMGLRPVQFVGDVSYSVYLWHFPLLVLTPFVIDRVSTTTPRSCSSCSPSYSPGSPRSSSRTPCGRSRRLTSRKPRVTFALVAARDGGHVRRRRPIGQRAAQPHRAVQKDRRRRSSPQHPRASAPRRATPSTRATTQRSSHQVVPTPIVAADTGNCAVHADRPHRARLGLRVRACPSPRRARRSRWSATATPRCGAPGSRPSPTASAGAG